MVKKTALLFIVALLALAVAGCSATGTPTPRPTDTTPSAMPTQAPPTGTPAPAHWLSGYSEHPDGRTQNMPGTEVPPMQCTIIATYRNGDWTLPQALRTLNGTAGHGVVYLLWFSNPTGSGHGVVAGDTIKSNVQYFAQGARGFLPTSDIFYDPATGREYGAFEVASGETRDAYMLAYFIDESAFARYRSALDVFSLDLNPHYFEMPK